MLVRTHWCHPSCTVEFFGVKQQDHPCTAFSDGFECRCAVPSKLPVPINTWVGVSFHVATPRSDRSREILCCWFVSHASFSVVVIRRNNFLLLEQLPDQLVLLSGSATQLDSPTTFGPSRSIAFRRLVYMGPQSSLSNHLDAVHVNGQERL